VTEYNSASLSCFQIVSADRYVLPLNIKSWQSFLNIQGCIKNYCWRYFLCVEIEAVLLLYLTLCTAESQHFTISSFRYHHVDLPWKVQQTGMRLSGRWVGFSHACAIVQITLSAVELRILLRFCALKMRASFNHLMYLWFLRVFYILITHIS